MNINATTSDMQPNLCAVSSKGQTPNIFQIPNPEISQIILSNFFKSNSPISLKLWISWMQFGITAQTQISRNMQQLLM
ncbi:hypothetical protein LDENG_00157830 [Lucifuga dentata]|nr:hypothetical protein LDENG_00157830 [Lucifuga dentata]